MKDTAIVFARAPRLGTVKRRLAQEIGDRAALRFHAGTLMPLLRDLKADGRFDVVLAITPCRVRVRVPPGVRTIPQGRGDLGERMSRALRAVQSGCADGMRYSGGERGRRPWCVSHTGRRRCRVWADRRWRILVDRAGASATRGPIWVCALVHGTCSGGHVGAIPATPRRLYPAAIRCGHGERLPTVFWMSGLTTTWPLSYMAGGLG